MAHATTLNTRELVETERHEIETVAPRPKRSLWRRIAEAFYASRQKQAEDEIARYLARSGGTLTDSLERDIANHALYGHRLV
jgi:hypothetical protein